MSEAIRIHNTLTQQSEELVTGENRRIRLFVCGPTVYDYSHLGHAKTYTQFDFIVRYLKWRGYDVYYLQNITDIDDKIIQRSREKNEEWNVLARRFEKAYLEDMEALHITSVTKYARATDHIEEIVSQVSRLLDLGFAYHTDDGIYFEISKFEDYGKLSKRNEIRENDAVSRIDSDSHKRGWNDFCLWKKSKPGEPAWETSLGTGRPGWHIEDTAITEKHFGQQYDIHGGAIDLIFPHHEAEMTQMESLSGKKPFVRFWMHTGFLNIDSQKMSKSLGNYKTIRSALESYDYRVLRLLFIGSHYRSPIDFSESALIQAKNTLEKIDEFVFRIDHQFDDVENEQLIVNLKNAVNQALAADFNSPKVFAAIFDFIKSQNIDGKNGGRVYDFFQEINSFMDIFQFNREVGDTHIESLIQKRIRYRAEKDFGRADAIRDELLKMGVKVYDSQEETTYRK